jgi:hypothetical protein
MPRKSLDHRLTFLLPSHDPSAAVSSEEDDFSGADDGPVITKSPAPRTPGRKAKEVPLPALDVEEEEAEVPSNDEDNGGDDQDNDDDEEDDNDDDDDDDDEQDEEEYVVEAIVNYRKNRVGRLYLHSAIVLQLMAL